MGWPGGISALPAPSARHATSRHPGLRRRGDNRASEAADRQTEARAVRTIVGAPAPPARPAGAAARGAGGERHPGCVRRRNGPGRGRRAQPPHPRPVRAPLPAHLPRERVVIPAPSVCPCCQGKLVKLGEDVTETLVIPRPWKVVQARSARSAAFSVSNETCARVVLNSPHISNSVKSFMVLEGAMAHRCIGQQRLGFSASRANGSSLDEVSGLIDWAPITVALPDTPGEVFADSAYRGARFREAVRARASSRPACGDWTNKRHGRASIVQTSRSAFRIGSPWMI